MVGKSIRDMVCDVCKAMELCNQLAREMDDELEDFQISLAPWYHRGNLHACIQTLKEQVMTIKPLLAAISDRCCEQTGHDKTENGADIYIVEIMGRSDHTSQYDLVKRVNQASHELVRLNDDESDNYVQVWQKVLNMLEADESICAGYWDDVMQRAEAAVCDGGRKND